MSVSKQHNERDYSVFDQMSTEELQEFLFQDSLLEDPEASDIDAILYITEVVARREKEDTTIKQFDVEAALASFHRDYDPRHGNVSGKASAVKSPRDADIRERPFNREYFYPWPRLRLRWKGSKIAIAVVIMIALSGMVVGALGGFDWVSNWGEGAYHSSKGPSNNPLLELDLFDDVPEPLQELQSKLVDYGVWQDVVPKYFPAGYELEECKVGERGIYQEINYMLSNADGSSIIFSYLIYPEEGRVLERTIGEEKEEYEVDGVTYSIMSNLKSYSVNWHVDNVDCSVVGLPSREELLKVIDSI